MLSHLAASSLTCWHKFSKTHFSAKSSLIDKERSNRLLSRVVANGPFFLIFMNFDILRILTIVDIWANMILIGEIGILRLQLAAHVHFGIV